MILDDDFGRQSVQNKCLTATIPMLVIQFRKAFKTTKVKDMRQTVHVFVGTFASRNAACEYTEEQWEPEPDESVSDEEYEAWEERNPTWKLDDDLDCDYLTGDFVETVTGHDRMEYLARMVTDTNAISEIRKQIGDDNANTLVLVFSAAFDGQRANVSSTPLLKYCGEYPCDLARR